MVTAQNGNSEPEGGDAVVAAAAAATATVTATPPVDKTTAAAPSVGPGLTALASSGGGVPTVAASAPPPPPPPPPTPTPVAASNDNSRAPSQRKPGDGPAAAARIASVMQFADVFTKAADIYRILARRQQLSPVFLKRNLWYMKPGLWEPSKASVHPHWRRRSSSPSAAAAAGASTSTSAALALDDPVVRARKRAAVDAYVTAVYKNTEPQGDAAGAQGTCDFELTFGELVADGGGGPDDADGAGFVARFRLERLAYCRRKRAFQCGNRLTVGEFEVKIGETPKEPPSIKISADVFEKLSGGPTQDSLIIELCREGIQLKDDHDGPPAKRKRTESGQEDGVAVDSDAVKIEVKADADADAGTRQPVPEYTFKLVLYGLTGENQAPVGDYELLLKRVGDGGQQTAATRAATGRGGLRWIRAPAGDTGADALSKKLQENRSLTMKAKVAWSLTGGSILPVPVSSREFARVRRTWEKARPDRKLSRERRIVAAANRRLKLQREAPLYLSYRYWADKRKVNCHKVAGTELNCVFCFVPTPCLYSLLKHYTLCHPRFLFVYTPLPCNGAQIDISINGEYDGRFCGNPAETCVVEHIGSLACRREPQIRSQATTVMIACSKWGGTRPKPSLAEFFANSSASGPHGGQPGDAGPYAMSSSGGGAFDRASDHHRSSVTGHRRLYYRSITCLPAPSADHVGDSDDENDPDWLKEKTRQMIDEFTDVNEGEKAMMKAWNVYKLHYNYTGDCQIPLALRTFLKNHLEWIVEQELNYNFCCHVLNLFTHGLLAHSHVLSACHKVNSLALARAREARAQAQAQAAVEAVPASGEALQQSPSS